MMRFEDSSPASLSACVTCSMLWYLSSATKQAQLGGHAKLDLLTNLLEGELTLTARVVGLPSLEKQVDDHGHQDDKK